MAEQLNIGVVMRPSQKQMANAIEKLQRGLKTKFRQRANKAVMTVLFRWVGEQFDTEGRHGGPAWEPFAPQYDSYSGELVGGRRMKGGGVDESAKLLQDRGTLRASFRPFADAGGLNVGIGSGLDYSEYHEEGTTYLPQRRMLPRHTDRELIQDILETYNFFFRAQVAEAFKATKRVVKGL